MSLELRRRLFDELYALTLVDPHTHIDPRDPASHTLADLLGYHYYTELAHSAGLSRDEIEDPLLDPREKVGRLIENLGPVDNTIQWSWLIEMSQKLFGFQGDQINRHNWESLYDAAESRMSASNWPQHVLQASNLEAVFLTNQFDDDLDGIDTSVYIPCLRTDDLVFQLTQAETQSRLERATGETLTDAFSLRSAIGVLFDKFTASGARACAISLPPDFTPTRVSEARADTALADVLKRGVGSSESHRRALSNYVFWTIAEFCNEYRVPFDLMIGVNRNVYEGGVHQGRDLYDSRVSLIQYKELFNAFPNVTFPVSVLASVTNQELTSFAWIFPNVVTNGHWWYSNTPTYIENDLAARLEAVPRNKQIGYYSDMYKLEFGLPKFAMYKRTLAKVLAERFVIDRGWSEERAIDLGKQILRGNVDRIFTPAQRPTVVMSTRSDAQRFSREISMNEAQAAATAGQLGQFHDERREPEDYGQQNVDDFNTSPLDDDLISGSFDKSGIHPATLDEQMIEGMADSNIRPIGSDDFNPALLPMNSDSGSFASYAPDDRSSQSSLSSSSNILDNVPLQPSFDDEEQDEVAEVQPLDDADFADVEMDDSALDYEPPAGNALSHLGASLSKIDAAEEQAELEQPTDLPPALDIIGHQPIDLGIDTEHRSHGGSSDWATPAPAAEKNDEWPMAAALPADEWPPVQALPADAAMEDDLEVSEIDLVEELPAEAVEEDEFAGFELVEEDDPQKTQVGPFQFPEPGTSQKNEPEGWDFRLDDDRPKHS